MEVLKNGSFLIRGVLFYGHALNVAAYKFLLKEDWTEPKVLAIVRNENNVSLFHDSVYLVKKTL